MIIYLDKTKGAQAKFSMLDDMSKGRAIAAAAAILTKHEDLRTFTALYDLLTAEEKQILENRITAMQKEIADSKHEQCTGQA